MKIHMLKYVVILGSIASIMACQSNVKPKGKTLTTTILPIKYLVENISGNDFNINVLVPPGSSPETFEPTPKQIAMASQSEFVFTIGLIDFEQELSKRLTSNNIVELHKGLEIKQGNCGHQHTDNHAHKGAGVDPHIWTSPRYLKHMATQIYNAIIGAYPDSVKYTENYNKLIASLNKTDSTIQDIVNASSVKHFIIYHPALSYYADDYGFTQISLEHDGKEPSVEALKNIINKAKDLKIDRILYQKEFSRATVTAATQDINVKCIEINPLSGDVEANLIDITKIITGHDENK